LITRDGLVGGFGAKLCAANTGRFRRLYAGAAGCVLLSAPGRRPPIRSRCGSWRWGTRSRTADAAGRHSRVVPERPVAVDEIRWYTVDFVGSRSSAQAPLADPDHEGHPDWTIGQLDAKIAGWLGTYEPDVVLLEVVRTTIAGHSTAEQAVAELSTLVGHIVAARPAAEVFVATLIPSPSDVLDKQFVRFNKAVPGIVAGNGGHVHLVDMYPALSVADFADPVAPHRRWVREMAIRWYRRCSAHS